MTETEQYQFRNNTLILHVARSPIFALVFIYLLSIICILLPFIGLGLRLAAGDGFHAGYLFGLVFFGGMGFFLLRIALWSTKGKEVITLNTETISYLAHYIWFTGNKKEIEATNNITFSIRTIGSEHDKEGALMIENGSEKIQCVTKMTHSELKKLIDLLEKR